MMLSLYFFEMEKSVLSSFDIASINCPIVYTFMAFKTHFFISMLRFFSLELFNGIMKNHNVMQHYKIILKCTDSNLSIFQN